MKKSDLGKRIMIIGSAGSGKTTLSDKLSKILDIEVIHLDRLYWKPNWTITPEEEWKMVMEEACNKDSWIIDGNYRKTIEMRLSKADTVIFIDKNRWSCLHGVLKRIRKNKGRQRSDMGEGCIEKYDWSFLWWVFSFPRKSRPKLIDSLK
jgi:Adenylate kinase and related kinases